MQMNRTLGQRLPSAARSWAGAPLTIAFPVVSSLLPAILLISLLAISGGCVRSSDDAIRDHPTAKTPATDASLPLGAAEKLVGRASGNEKATSAAPTVELIIDYGDSVQKHLVRIPWREHLTTLDVLAAAKNRPHGVTFAARGSGSTAFVTQVDDLKNQGGGDDAKNWVFRINDHLVDKSCGLAEVRPGDVILWKFGAYE
jgi:hypothetical protein